MEIPNCLVSPELTEGPYFVDEQLNRSDVRSDCASDEVREGARLDLAVNVLQVRGDDCTPLGGAMVDIWQCDALGVYSDVVDPGFDTMGQTFLRGYQLTDGDGSARFVTIYPGWYEGRTVHIHFKVRSDSGSGEGYEFTSQFFFDEALTDQVHARQPYAAKGERTLRNAGDSIYQQSGDMLTLDVSERAGGYTASIDIGLQLS